MFERGSHPYAPVHRVVKIRVLKLLTPVTPNPAFPAELRYLVEDSRSRPREGVTLRRGAHPWTIDLDDGGTYDKARQAFAALFANAGLPPLRVNRPLRPRAPGEKDLEARRAALASQGDEAEHGGARRLLSRVGNGR